VLGRLALAAFVLIVAATVIGRAVPARWGVDVSITTWVVEHRTGWLTAMFKAFTWLGSTAFLLPFGVVLAAVLCRHERRIWPAVFLGTATIGAVVLYDTIKVTVGRERPAIGQLVSTATGYAFPSGHAAQSIAFGGAVALLVTHRSSRRARVLALAIAGVWAFFVGASRVYLGVHWTSDVIGGWVLGTVWLAVVARVLTRADRPLPASGS
jgi:undecaprenyl-diphosphatase